MVTYDRGIGGQLSMQNGNVQLIGVPSTLNVGIAATWLQGAQFWLGGKCLTREASSNLLISTGA